MSPFAPLHVDVVESNSLVCCTGTCDDHLKRRKKFFIFHSIISFAMLCLETCTKYIRVSFHTIKINNLKVRRRLKFFPSLFVYRSLNAIMAYVKKDGIEK